MAELVYGVGYKDHFRVAHKRATTKEERNEFKGSKYVQSDLDGIFGQVKEDLKQGNTVLFSGTPCQTAGLNSYIGKKLRENLVLVDIVCHGVPSPYIWRDYLTYLENKYKSKVVKVNFRDKSRIGWSGHIESFVFANKNKVELDVFKYLFGKNIMLRSSCGSCVFTNFNRPSDITIGDYWGWEKISKDFNNDNKGCSLLLINTIKGQIIFNKISNNLFLLKSDKEKSVQPNLEKPSVLDKRNTDFKIDFQRRGFKYIAKKYGNIGWRYWINTNINKAKRKIKQIINI